MDTPRDDKVTTTRGLHRLRELLLATERQRLEQLAGELRQLAGATRAGEDTLARRLEASERSTRTLIEEMRARLDPVYESVGTREQLCKSVADILDAALRDAEVERHAELSQALAPLLVKTIKTEIVNSRDEMVEALYPITGRLVKAYVANAVKDMMVDINRRLEVGMPGRRAALRLRSLLTGRSPAELALAEAQRLEVVELLLIRRGSGELVASWDRERDGPLPMADGGAAAHVAPTVGAAVPAGRAERRRDNGAREALVGGLLSAITSFAETAFESDPASLRRLDRENDAIYLRATPAFILAARCSGTAPAPIEQLVDNELLATLDRHGAVLTHPGARPAAGSAFPVDAVLPDLAGRLERGITERQATYASARGSFVPLLTVAALILLPLLGWIAWQAYGTWENNRVRTAARAVVTATSELRGYPVHVSVDRRGRQVHVTGLAPTEDFRRRLQEQITAVVPQADVHVELAVLPTVVPVDQTPAITRVAEEGRRAMAQLAEELRRATTAREAGDRQLEAALTGSQQRQLAALAEASKASRDRVGELETETAARLSAIEQALAAIAARPLPAPVAVPVATRMSPRERLAAWARDNAIFFGEGANYRDSAAAERALGELAELIKATEDTVRVAGYTDERGGQTRNTPLAQSRAQRVVDDLVALGVPRGRLISVGRANGPDLSPDIGPTSPNRRVEFEPTFRGEIGGRP
jgi:outer membrane protein OmpA-like peptidoglycan-associated protein